MTAYENKHWNTMSDTNKIIDNASLEDLESLFAASAKRLAGFHLGNSSSTTTASSSSTHESNKWKNFLNSDLTTLESDKKSPSENYLKLRNMFESNQGSNSTITRRKSSRDLIDSPSKLTFDNPQKSYNEPINKLVKTKKPPQINAENDQTSTLKLSTLASLQQRQRPEKDAIKKNEDIKSIEEYINSVKQSSSSNMSKFYGNDTCTKPTSSTSRKIKTPNTAAKSSSTTNVKKSTHKNSTPHKSTSTSNRRKKEKESSDSVIKPKPPIKTETVPSMSDKITRSLTKTPTRIPLPSKSPSKPLTNKQPLPKKTNVPPLPLPKKQSIVNQPLRKPKSTSILDKPRSQPATRTNKSTDVLKKPGGLVSSTSKPKTLQERLQGLVDESQSWTSQIEREKAYRLMERSEVTIRGKGITPQVTVRVAMTPEAALKLYQFNLTSYEQQEMTNYEHIYFVGHHAKKRPASPSITVCNHGYDDERGDYMVQLKDHLDYRYEVIEVLGKGSFGQVLKCFDHHLGQTVAVKIIRNKKRFHAQALVEVKILKELIAWDSNDKHNTVRMLGHFMFRNHLCIVFECLSMNLYQFIKSNAFQGLSMGLIRRFATQLLNALVLLQKHKLIHCDLKPENILLKNPSKSTIKIIDFGSSCLESEKLYTYIQSRFYRSPEVILGMSYSVAIDMWSVGCILAELYTGYPLFPGENEQEQLACIMEIQGIPEPYLVEKSSRNALFFDSEGKPRIQPNSKGRKRHPNTKSLEQVLKTTDEHFLDFVSRCLCWDPEKRIKPDEAQKHPWMLKSFSKNKSSPR